MSLREQSRRARPGAWITGMRAARQEVKGRVLVFPHAGAGPNALTPLLAALPEDHEVFGVTLPGRERRFSESYERTPDDPQAVVDGVLTELRRLPAGRPTVFFGHSMGVAVAVAVALAEPALCARLVLSAHPPAGVRYERADDWDDQVLLDIIRLGGGTPPEILENPFWRGYVLGLLRSDLSLAGRLVRRNRNGRLTTPLTVLGGDRDELVDPADLLTWTTRTTATSRTRLFPGGHFYLLDEPNRAAVAAEITGRTNG
ncbi:thioesterase II family protein [Sphaerisporangium fuscum]|uniref:thioesterase II family protein n=1 Tax=Sphaerisporangium fuscum TaxID=2835868 RepID=UPI001BDCEDF2|nr:alpha/beta fold hydrolase [Sphaerisporangium fuscum]